MSSIIKIQNYINGQWQDAVSGNTLPVINPATGKTIASLPCSNEEDVEIAYAAAAKAFVSWSKSSVEERFGLLNKIAELIESKVDELALAETEDNGKPLWLSKSVDIKRAADNFRFFATAIMHFHSDSHTMPQSVHNFTIRKPLGVVACISPWNLPLYLFTWKIAPALASGNCVVAKPSEVTPLTAFLLSKICKEAGLPAGVLNIIHGDGVSTGKAMVSHPKIKAISFTGSTRAGRDIASIAAPMFKKLSLELGGKNPNLIFADCNWDKMMKTTLRSSFSNQGQICLCGSRILVEKSIYEKFKTEFVAKVKELKVGNPKDDKTKIGAIVSKVHFDKINSYIKIAKEEGGKILCGGNIVSLPGDNKDGLFIEPTVIENLGPQCRTNLEEIFGPVVTLQSFETEEEALAIANASEYGLSATIWTQNVSRAHRLSELIESGIIWINTWLLRDLRTPFGGIKNSGVGREGGWYALQFFTEPKNICIDFND